MTHPTQGTPQGGVISPLLANVYLHWFDRFFHRPQGPRHWANARLVRYADDFVILARHQGEGLRTAVEKRLEGAMGLRLNREKTRVVDLKQPGASLDFLGFTFRFVRDRHGGTHRYLEVAPSEKALQRERGVLREKTSARWGWLPLPDLIETLNRHLLGWGNYVRHRLWRQLRRRSQRRYRQADGQTLYRHLEAAGLIRL